MRFSINPDGTLVRQAPDVSVNGQAYNIVIAPNQNRLYVSEPDTCQIYGFSIASGNLTAISGTPWSTAGVRPLQMTIDPSGSFLYVVNQSTNNVSGFIISSSDGSLSPLLNSPYALSGSGPSPVGIVFDPQGSFVYVGESNGHVAMMSISGGIPTEVSGSPFSSGDVGTQWLTVTPDGNCVIAANTGSTTLSTFTINRSTPALNMVSGSPFGTGANNPEIMAMDPSGAFVYAPCNGLSGTPGLSVMTINADHSLTGLSGNPFSAGTLPLAVTVH